MPTIGFVVGQYLQDLPGPHRKDAKGAELDRINRICWICCRFPDETDKEQSAYAEGTYVSV